MTENGGKGNKDREVRKQGWGERNKEVDPQLQRKGSMKLKALFNALEAEKLHQERLHLICRLVLYMLQSM